ncbi:hypothetical protein HanXRQr2_Chr04g0188531 [Helianthus annuus]|uniref:Uncharacterized protein n=1 Tax=Helianthus annuus TaxID=4232 RepID=A0A9K3JBV0_HELAN|nr:hypothetical protein HanXRQr2_Chr04g0188531 [Helianthus annuus]
MVISREIHQDQSNRSSYYLLLFLRFRVFNGDLYTWKFRRCRRWIPSLTCYVVVSIVDSFAASEISTRLVLSKAKAIFTQVRVQLGQDLQVVSQSYVEERRNWCLPYGLISILK